MSCYWVLDIADTEFVDFYINFLIVRNGQAIIV